MADDKKKKGEPFPGTVQERPDDAHPGTPLGGFADRDDTADADTQGEGGTTENPPPPPVEPPDGGQSHDPRTGG